MDWLGAILERIRDTQCPCCGARLEGCAVRGITAEPTAVVVRLACALCGENSLAVVRRDRPRIAVIAPITEDDVLDAHEFLKGWQGPVSEALATQAS